MCVIEGIILRVGTFREVIKRQLFATLETQILDSLDLGCSSEPENLKSVTVKTVAITIVGPKIFTGLPRL